MRRGIFAGLGCRHIVGGLAAATVVRRTTSRPCGVIPGKWIASAFVPSVMTTPLVASEPFNCSAAPASPVSETTSALCNLPLTSIVALSERVTAIVSAVGLSLRSASELPVNESDPERVLISTAVSLLLIAKPAISPASASEAAALTATATAVLSAAMMASSAAARAAVTFARMLAGCITVAEGAFV